MSRRGPDRRRHGYHSRFGSGVIPNRELIFHNTGRLTPRPAPNMAEAPPAPILISDPQEEAAYGMGNGDPSREALAPPEPGSAAEQRERTRQVEAILARDSAVIGALMDAHRPPGVEAEYGGPSLAPPQV